LKTRKKVAFSAVGFFAVLICIWMMMPMSSDMRLRPNYYLWAHGFYPLTESAYFAFTRDTEFQNELIGEPVESIQDLFPDLKSGATYEAGSYRNTYSETTDRQGKPVECYWLKGSKNEFGFCALVRDGLIVEFRYIKG